MPLLHRRSLQLAQPAHRTSRVQAKASHGPAVLTSGMAVVLANDLNGDVLQLQLPATSIFGKAEGDNHPLQSYARLLAAQSISPEMVVTRMKFDTQKESPKLFFKPVRWLTDDEHAAAVEKGQSDDAKRAVTMTVAQTDKLDKPVMPVLEGKPPVAKKAKPPKAQG
jgi:hypothetical protein